MVYRSNIDISKINHIIKKTVKEINNSRDQILTIVDNARNEYETLKLELITIKKKTETVIEQVDQLEIDDKKMRKKLAHVSKNFNIYSEEDIKAAYEEASNIKIEYITKQNEEKDLRQKRTQLELSLKKTLATIESAETVMNQISIAINYLNGEILSSIEGMDKNSEMLLGIKILEAQENERKRISRDIHDGPAQHIANIVMRADICERIIKDDLEQGLEELAELKEAVKIALKEVRNIIYDLRPMTLDDLGLNHTIQELLNTFIENEDISIESKLMPMKIEVESIIQIALYRIIQEIFNNIKKHSKAKQAKLFLDYGTKYLRLKVTDDGIGFNVDETLERVKTRGESYGLVGILDRVNQLQGELNIESILEKGTSYKVKLPVNREVIKDEQHRD